MTQQTFSFAQDQNNYLLRLLFQNQNKKQKAYHPLHKNYLEN